MPFFTVIIPLYNKEQFIGSTLKSILQQHFTDFEIVIIDDGSTDNSVEKIKEFDDERIRFYTKENGGVSTARNYGIEQAAADYITFIDADDYWYPDFLQQMHRNINRFPEQQVFSAAIEIETEKNIIPAQYSIGITHDCEIVNYFDASSKMSVIWTSCAVFHKSVFAAVGNFDVKIKSGQDTDLWIRIGLTYPVVFCRKILARYTFDSESLSNKPMNLNQKLNFSKFSALEKENPKLKKFLDLNRFSFAIHSGLRGDTVNYKHFKNALDSNNLTLKKRVLLRLPSFALQSLLQLNIFLNKIGMSDSVFK